MWICKNCQIENEDATTVCQKCSVARFVGDEVELESNSENSKLVKCNTCGNSVSKNASACPKCGEPFNAKQEKKKSGCGSFVFVSFCIVFVLMLAMKVLTPSNSSNSSSNYKKTSTLTSSNKSNTTAEKVPSISGSQAEKIKEYAEREWGTDAKMVDYEYKKQVDSYNYYIGLTNSKIKEYSLIEWTDGQGYTDWSMVEYEYDKQISSYNYMQGVENGDYAVTKWTEGGYTDWTMAEYEYRK